MQTIQQFFADRGGRFTQEDLLYLANYGLIRLMEDSMGMPPLDPQYSYPQDEKAAPYENANPQPITPPAQPVEANLLPRFEYMLNGIGVTAVGKPMEPEVLEFLRATAYTLKDRRDARVVVLHPWVGEEVLAVLSGFTGTKPQLFAIGSFDGCTSKDWSDIVAEYSPRDVIEIMQMNMTRPDAMTVNIQVADPVNLAGSLDPQDVSLLVLPPCRSSKELESWLPHMRSDGIVCGWGDSWQALSSYFHGIGLNVSTRPWFSIGVDKIKRAINEKQRSTPQVPAVVEAS